MTSCPCNPELEYEACCGRFHQGEPAPTAEALMRSRYSAFAMGLWDYLEATQVQPLEPSAEVMKWVRLQLHEASENEVTFTATYLTGHHAISLRERSRFRVENGKWLYVNGANELSDQKIRRNELCPCGQGKKFKHCHGDGA